MENTGLITSEFVNNIIKERPEDIHKGQCGRVLIVAGKRGMAGAAILAAGAALKSGAGLVTIAAPTNIFDILQTAVPQATCIDVSEGFDRGSVDIYDAIAVGPGLGVDENKFSIIGKILNNYSGPVVLDADGINCLCRYDNGLSLIKKRNAPTVLTPHPGEGNRILKALGLSEISVMGRIKAAETISLKTNTVMLLKGAGTVVADKEKQTYVNTTGNPGMATGGSGDVLTGVITSLIAGGIDCFNATMAGAYIHGLAGDIAAEKIGQWGMTSLDIQLALPAAFKKIIGK